MSIRFPGWHAPPSNLLQASWIQKIAYGLATTLGSGHLPASGTWGALVAWGIHTYFFPNAFLWENRWQGIFILLLIIVIGTWSAEVVERYTKEKDDSRITIDEVAGYCLAVMFVPAGIQYTLPAFLLARFFDIIKPPPANHLQDLHGGIGIMIDDLIASVYACACMHILIYFFYP